MATSSISPWSRLFDLIALERRDLATLLAFGVGVGLLSLATPLAVQALIGVVAFGGLLQPIVVLAILFAGVLGLAAALKAAQTWVVELISRRMFLRVGREVARRAMRPEGDQNLVKLTNRFFDVVTVEKASAVLLFDGIAVVLQIVAGITLLALYHPVLLAFDILVVVAVAAIVLIPGPSAMRTALLESSAKYAVADWLEELALHPEAFASARGGRFARAIVDEKLLDWANARRLHFKRVFAQIVGFLGLQVATMTALLGIGGWLVVERELAMGQLVAAELVMAATVSSLARLGKLLQKSYDLFAGLEKIGLATDLPDTAVEGEVSLSSGAGLAVGIDRPELSAHVDAGEKVRLVGAEGSGKTHLLRALALLEEDRAGIELDGVDARVLAPAVARDVVMLLGQGGLIEGTIEENLRVGSASARHDDLAAALRQVGLHEVVRELPLGIKTPLGRGGSPLSSSQAKRLLVARALVATPGLLLVDGFLDDLAPEVRGDLCELLLAPSSPWTVILVTHHPELAARLRTLALTRPRGRSHESSAPVFGGHHA